MDTTFSYDAMNFFVPMLIVGIGVALLATGMFTSYFGAGKSQKIGYALLFFGIVILALVYLMTFGGVDAIFLSDKPKDRVRLLLKLLNTTVISEISKSDIGHKEVVKKFKL